MKDIETEKKKKEERSKQKVNCKYTEVLLYSATISFEKLGELMTLVDYPNQCVAFPINLCTKLIVDKRVWWTKGGGGFMRIHCILLPHTQHHTAHTQHHTAHTQHHTAHTQHHTAHTQHHTASDYVTHNCSQVFPRALSLSLIGAVNC